MHPNHKLVILTLLGLLRDSQRRKRKPRKVEEQILRELNKFCEDILASSKPEDPKFVQQIFDELCIYLEHLDVKGYEGIEMYGSCVSTLDINNSDIDVSIITGYKPEDFLPELWSQVWMSHKK